MKILLVYPLYPDSFWSFRHALKFIGRKRLHFWNLFFWSLARRPRLFPLSITYAIYGFHFRKVAEKISGGGVFDGYGASARN